MHDLISIGNISVDLFFKGSSLTISDGRFQFAVGGKYFADSVYETLGGGGANVAIGCAKHGLKTAVLGQIGNNPFKTIILEKLKQNSVSHSLCQFTDNYFNVSSIFLTDSGERSIVHYTTPNNHIFTNETKQSLLTAKAVYVGNLPHVSFTEKVHLLHFLKKNKIFTVVNLGVTDCRKTREDLISLLTYANVLIVNGFEFADLIKKNFKEISFSDHVIKKYADYLLTSSVIITLGNKGSMLYTRDEVIHQEAFPTSKIVDTTGAGDGFTAGFISGFHFSHSLKDAMKEGSRYAAKILGHIGAN